MGRPKVGPDLLMCGWQLRGLDLAAEDGEPPAALPCDPECFDDPFDWARPPDCDPSDPEKAQSSPVNGKPVSVLLEPKGFQDVRTPRSGAVPALAFFQPGSPGTVDVRGDDLKRVGVRSG